MNVRSGWMSGIVVVLLAATLAVAQEKKQAAGGHEEDLPGPVHKQMAKLAGEYSTVTKFMFKAGEPGQETIGTARLRSILGGRFLSEESSGTMMGQKFQGMHLYGYNNASGKYEGTWMYTGSTALMNLVGTSKDDGKTIDYVATVDQKGSKMTLYILYRNLDDDHFVVELITKNPDGSKGPTLETTYTRKK